MENINELLNRYKLPIILSLVGVVLIIGGVVSSGLLSKPKALPTSFPVQSLVKTTSAQDLKIDISGAIVSPGVYILPLLSRMEDAVKVAGGFSPKANAEFISKQLNLSQKISDGQKIYIPYEGEGATAVSAGSGGVVEGASTGPVDINSASEAELDSLPSVGTVTAQKIISGRPYTSVDDLKSKKVVSASVFDKIKDKISAQ